MSNGKYRTAAGSRVEVSGEHSGEFRISFDWLEEKACFDCRPTVEEDSLRWDCAHCGNSVSAKLTPVQA